MNIFCYVFRLIFVFSLTHIGYSIDQSPVKGSYTSDAPYLYWTQLYEKAIMINKKAFYPQASSLNQRNLLNEIAIKLFGVSEDKLLIKDIKFQKFLSMSKLNPNDVVTAQYDSNVQSELQKISITEIKEYSNLPIRAQNAISKALERPELVQEPLRKTLRDYVDSKTKTLKTFIHANKNGNIQRYLINDINNTNPTKHSIVRYNEETLPENLRKILDELFNPTSSGNGGGSPYSKPEKHHGSRFDDM